jgi:hypothetical protein
VQDVRNLNQTRVMLEYNAGFQAALAGLQESPGTWEVCLQVLISLPHHPTWSCVIMVDAFMWHTSTHF